MPSIDAGISARLDTHDWPGNVRELRNYAQRVTLAWLTRPRPAPEMEPLPLRVERFEGDVIRTVLEEVQGDVRSARNGSASPARPSTTRSRATACRSTRSAGRNNEEPLPRGGRCRPPA